MSEFERIKQSLKSLPEGLQVFTPQVIITLGTGLGGLVDRLVDGDSVLYTDITHCPPLSASGHEGKLYWGTLGGGRVVLLQGRCHLYSGRSVHDVVFMTRLMCLLSGYRGKFVFTHSCGAVTKNLEPGDIVAIRSHVGMWCPDPTAGQEGREVSATEFTPLGEAYSPRIIRLAKEVAREQANSVSLSVGVSCFKPGRSFESEAEIDAMRRLGADVATMSTIPEVVAAVHMGAEVLDLAFVSNMGAGLEGVSDSTLSHYKVQRLAMEKIEGPFGDFIVEVVRRMVLLP